jgi:HEAT repeat protein
MVDADRPAVRPLLEQALRDADAWTRWKALRGLVEIGIEPSRTAVAQLADDPDFRVRLETARALGEPRG